MSLQRYSSAVRSATFVGDDNKPPPVGVNAITAVLDATTVPGTDTVQLVIEGRDPLSGKYYQIAASSARVAAGTDVLQVGQGLPASSPASAAGVVVASANAAVPATYRARVIHSAGSNFTYSLSCHEV